MPTLGEGKRCCHCKEFKSLDLFNNDKNKPDGKAVTCKDCRSKQRKVLRAKDPQKFDAAGKKWRESNRDKYAEWAFKRRHKISREDVLKIVEQQGGCKICKTKSPIGDGNWHVDHDHSCCYKGSCDKCRRGILCNFCNSMIGYAREDEQILINAIEYIKEYRKENRWLPLAN